MDPLWVRVVAVDCVPVTVSADVAESLEATELIPVNTALYVCIPGPGVHFNEAVPAPVSCAEPNACSTSHAELKDKSQKRTWPLVILEDAAPTAAEKITAVPEGTVVTVPPPEVIVRVVDVAD